VPAPGDDSDAAGGHCHSEVLLKRLGLTTVHKLFSGNCRDQKRGVVLWHFLERLLSEEVAHRAETRIAAQVARAKFLSRYHRPLTFRSDFKRQMLGRFLGPELVSDNRSLILEGPPGTERHIYVLPLPIKRSRTALSLVSPLPLFYQRAALEL